MEMIFAMAVVFVIGAYAVAGDCEYRHGWKVYEKPQPGATCSYGQELNPYGPGGGKNPLNPWRVAD